MTGGDLAPPVPSASGRAESLGNRNAGPAVRDLEGQRSVRLRHRDGHRLIARAAQRVVHEIRHHAKRLHEIEGAKQRRLGIVDDRLDAFRLGHSRELTYRRAQQILRRVDLRVHRERASLESREIEHVSHHLAEPVRLPDDDLGVPARVGAIGCNVLRQRAYRRERRPQIVTPTPARCP